ncbi:MAG: DUF2283 domain-containing protein [Chloroflexi bacterium]|nr:DUF2283 domain-containing protein [Chloroflexota bacterium]
MKTEVNYFKESDMLSLWTGKPAKEAEEIAAGVIVDFDAEGNVVGFTLEHAAEILRPMLEAHQKTPATAAPSRSPK